MTPMRFWPCQFVCTIVSMSVSLKLGIPYLRKGQKKQKQDSASVTKERENMLLVLEVSASSNQQPTHDQCARRIQNPKTKTEREAGTNNPPHHPPQELDAAQTSGERHPHPEPKTQQEVKLAVINSRQKQVLNERERHKTAPSVPRTIRQEEEEDFQQHPQQHQQPYQQDHVGLLLPSMRPHTGDWCDRRPRSV